MAARHRRRTQRAASRPCFRLCVLAYGCAAMTAGFQKNLPAEITKRLLEHGSRVAKRSASLAADFSRSRDEIRRQLEDVISAVPDDVLEKVPSPSVAAVDGALICDSKSIGDLC